MIVILTQRGQGQAPLPGPLSKCKPSHFIRPESPYKKFREEALRTTLSCPLIFHATTDRTTTVTLPTIFHNSTHVLRATSAAVNVNALRLCSEIICLPSVPYCRQEGAHSNLFRNFN